MGGRQSKRSVDITTTPKKGEIDGQPLDGKLEKIEDGVEKPAQANGATHLPPDAQDAEEKAGAVVVNGTEAVVDEDGDAPSKPVEEEQPAAETTTEAADGKPKKDKKDRSKKKWSFRAFSRKDKKVASQEDAAKNGDVAKQEPFLADGRASSHGKPTATLTLFIWILCLVAASVGLAYYRRRMASPKVAEEKVEDQAMEAGDAGKSQDEDAAEKVTTPETKEVTPVTEEKPTTEQIVETVTVTEKVSEPEEPTKATTPEQQPHNKEPEPTVAEEVPPPLPASPPPVSEDVKIEPPTLIKAAAESQEVSSNVSVEKPEIVPEVQVTIPVQETVVIEKSVQSVEAVTVDTSSSVQIVEDVAPVVPVEPSAVVEPVSEPSDVVKSLVETSPVEIVTEAPAPPPSNLSEPTVVETEAVAAAVVDTKPLEESLEQLEIKSTEENVTVIPVDPVQVVKEEESAADEVLIQTSEPTDVSASLSESPVKKESEPVSLEKSAEE